MHVMFEGISNGAADFFFVLFGKDLCIQEEGKCYRLHALCENNKIGLTEKAMLSLRESDLKSTSGT